MSTPAYPNDAGERPPDYRPRPAPDDDCDPDLLDDLTCVAKGIEAQAAYNAATLEGLNTARTQFKGARKAYGDARDGAAPKVREAGKQLEKLIDQLICLIDDRGTVHRLDRAFGRVEDRLEQCGDRSGCYCRTDCDFDDELHDCPPEDLPARIATIERRTKEAEECFADLIKEPASLTERVTNAQAEIADIATKISGSPETTDFRRLYAAALVARRHLAAVWRGFADVNAYFDCICRILTCMLKGHTAIAELKRREAVHKCRRDAEVAACEHLRANTVEEVIAEYLRLGAGYPDEGGEEEPGGYAGGPPEHDGDRDGDSHGDRPPRQYGERPAERYGERPADRPEGHDPRQHGDREEGDDRPRYPAEDDPYPRRPEYRDRDREDDRYRDRSAGDEPPPR